MRPVPRPAPLAALLVGVAGGAVAAPALAPASPTQGPIVDVQCRIRAEPIPGFLRLEAVARSPSDLEGQYRLSVLKRSASGTSRNVQSGAFSLAAGSDQVLSTLVLDASARGHYEAQLILEWDRGRATCQSP